MTNEQTIDSLDKEILTLLQSDGRMSNVDMARKVGRAPSAVLERVRKLERGGYIKGFEAILDPKALGFGLTAFTQVQVSEAVGSFDTGQQLAGVSGVLEVHYTAGEDSYLIKVRTQDTDSLQQILAEIGAIDGVRDTKTTIVLTTVQESRTIPLSHDDTAEDKCPNKETSS